MSESEREALRAGDWRHAKWCRWERVEEGGECNCGLDSFRAALSPGPDPVTEHARQSAAGTHLYDESCALCNVPGPEPVAGLDDDDRVDWHGVASDLAPDTYEEWEAVVARHTKLVALGKKR